jgi:hypothetical protein
MQEYILVRNKMKVMASMFKKYVPDVFF